MGRVTASRPTRVWSCRFAVKNPDNSRRGHAP
jgi:hypothetical protein